MIKLIDINQTHELFSKYDKDKEKTAFICRTLNNSQKTELLSDFTKASVEGDSAVMKWSFRWFPKCVISISGIKVKTFKTEFGGKEIKGLDPHWVDDNLRFPDVCDIMLQVMRVNGMGEEEKKK